MISYLTIQISQLLNTIPTISPSQLEKYLDCPQAWYYGYKEGLRKINSNTMKMQRGTYSHRHLHYYYHLLQAGYRPGSPTVIASMDNKFKEDMKEITIDNSTMLSTSIPIIRRFIAEQSPQIDSQIKVIAVEKEYFVLIVTPKGHPVFLHGIIDLVYRNLYNKLRIRDHKTGEKGGTYNQYNILLESQLLMYNLAMQLEYGEEIDGVEINFINLAAKPAIRFEKIGTFHSTDSILFFQANLMIILDKMLDGDIYRHYSKDCGSCTYSKLCQLETKGMSTIATVSTQYERTNRGNQFITGTKTKEAIPRQPERNLSNTIYKDLIIEW